MFKKDDKFYIISNRDNNRLNLSVFDNQTLDLPTSMDTCESISRIGYNNNNGGIGATVTTATKTNIDRMAKALSAELPRWV